ncbi:MAG: SPW repeat protein [Candidatus Dormiibacterota bacterium]
MSTAFKRWQDWAVVAIGVVVFATPFVFGETSSSSAAYSAYIMGGLVAVVGLVSAFLANSSKIVEGIVTGLGVILFFTPWLFGFTAVTATSWVSWIAGVLVVGVSGIAFLAEKPQRTVTN